MDVLPRITRQLFELIEKMTIPQRILFSLTALLVLAGFGWIVAQNQQGAFRPLAAGKFFSDQEFVAAEQALSTAKLTAFRREGQQLLAPADQVEKYNAVVAQTNESPPDLGTQMLRQYETMGPFSTDRQRQQMKEALLLQELRLMIKNVPEIEDARVAVASSDRKMGWNQRPRTTANITLKPKLGKEISAGLVSSLRHVVANMIPDLDPADVTIFDVTKGAVYSTTVKPIETAADEIPRTTNQVAQSYERQLRKALAHIRNANVTVHVEKQPSPRVVADLGIDESWSEPMDEPDSYETGFRGSEEAREQASLQRYSDSHSVKVGVTFPRDFVNQIAKRRANKGETSRDRLAPDLIEDEVISQIERIVSRLIPGLDVDNAVSVTCVDPVSNDSKTEATDQKFARIEKLLQQWKWPLVGLAIALFAFVLLLTGRRTVQPSTSISDLAIDSNLVTTESIPEPISIPSPVVTSPDRVAHLRDEVRSLVSSDPSASAAILAQWLSESAA